MNVVFRTDASVDIGTGHVIRCLTLAQALKARGAHCFFVCRELDGNMIELIEHRGFQARALRSKEAIGDMRDVSSTTGSSNLAHHSWLGVHWVVDADETVEALREITVDILFVDHYGLDIQWENSLRGLCKHLVVIDDLADRRHNCDLLIDQTLGRHPGEYKTLVPSQCQLLVGSDYALLRPEFSVMREGAYDRVVPDSPLRVLVSMGGMDRPNATLSVLKLLVVNPELKITVLLGPKALNYDSVVSFCHEYGNVEHIDFYEDMAPLMAAHDIAIGAPGTTSWERACLGMPNIIVPLAYNQQGIARKLEEYGASAVITLEDLETLFWKVFKDVCSEWSFYQDNNLRICDGLGLYRVLIELDALIIDDLKYKLLPARESDIDDVFQWQSHPRTREYANNKEIPLWTEHKKWMSSKLTSQTDYFYIISHAATQEKMGAVRLDRFDRGSYEVSIYTHPDKYGQGVAIAGLTILDRLHPHLTINATVLRHNTASQRLFEKAKYHRVSDERFIRSVIV